MGTPLAKHQRERVSALGIEGRVIELGGLSSARLARVYAACDALAQPSLGEGFGVPVIEAMACGLPVVASNRGALPEVVGDAGVLVAVPEDGGANSGETVTAFARGLAAVFDDARMGEELRRRGFERAAGYRAERVLPLLGSAYRKALTSSSR
ncbi:MAG TPA: glycosyltransferase [Tepidiformaceae bacterium]|nr:glycosyltransferase [Tepidiformaceae bacterium]